MRDFLKQFYCFNSEEGGGGGSAAAAESPATESAESGSTEGVSIKDDTSSEVRIGFADTSTEGKSLGFDVPEEYQEKGWYKELLKNEKPSEALLKQFDNAQSMIGKKAPGVPAADAGEEAWEAFYASTRPETAEAYELEPTDFGEEHAELAEVLREARSPEMVADVKEMFHKFGIAPRQAKEMAAAYDQLTMKHFGDKFSQMGEQQKLSAEQEAERDAKFDTLSKQVFGDDVDNVLDVAQKELERVVPEGFEKDITSLDNRSAVMLAAALHAQAKRYGAEDSWSKKDATPAMTDETRRIEASRILAELDKTDKMSPAYDRLTSEWNALYQ